MRNPKVIPSLGTSVYWEVRYSSGLSNTARLRGARIFLQKRIEKGQDFEMSSFIFPLLALFMFGCSNIEIQKTVFDPAQIQRIRLAGGPRGIFDPSFEVDPV